MLNLECSFYAPIGGIMKVKLLITVTAICLCVASSCCAQTANRDMTSGNGFLNRCGTPDSSVDICDMYLWGIFQGIYLHPTISHTQTGNMNPILSLPFCVKDGVHPYDLRIIVVGYIQRHPNEQKLGTDLLALWAFEEALPCHYAAPSNSGCYSSGRPVDCPAPR